MHRRPGGRRGQEHLDEEIGAIEDILAGVVWEFRITQAWAVAALSLMAVPIPDGGPVGDTARTGEPGDQPGRGHDVPQYGMPLDRWIVVPLLRLLPSRTRTRLEQAGDITDVVRPLEPDGTVPGLPDWRWVHTPGHTPGHVAYHRPRDGVVITGDAVVTVDLNSVTGVLTGRRRMSGPPRYTTWSWPEAVRSVATLAALEPQVLAPGHGRPQPVGAAAALHALAAQLTAPRAGRSTSGGRAGRRGP